MTVKIYHIEIGLTLDDYRMVGNLTREAYNLGMASLTEDNHLTSHLRHLFMGCHNLALQLRHNRAGGVRHDGRLKGVRHGHG